jgi:ATP-binding cassette subfamily F protein uup
MPNSKAGASLAQHAKQPETSARTERNRTNKLSYKEQRELDSLPERIALLEAEQSELNRRLADPATYQVSTVAGTSPDLAGMSARVAAIDEELLQLLERWQVLEQR